MEYIVLDLEWNQSSGGEEEKETTLPFEIIEIGALKLNNRRSVIDTFHRIIKPKVYKHLHNITKSIIQLKEEDLEQGVDFVDAGADFAAWCGQDTMFCTWGPSDLVELQRNMNYFKIDMKFRYPLYYYDVQHLFSLAYEEIMQQRTLEYAVHYLEIDIDREFHSAESDAFYTAKVFARINPNLAKKYYSVDTYCYPKTEEEEIKLGFPEYSLFVTRAYHTKEELKENKDILMLNCILCNKRTKRVLPWFVLNMRTTVGIGRCKEHGYFRGKLLIKNPEDDVYYGIRTVKHITEEEVEEICLRKEDRREKRREKRHK